MSPEPELCVVHLVRKANGHEPFRRFIDSYRAHDAGVAHDLVLLFKGFASEAETEPYREHAADVSSRSLSVGDEGFDTGAYLAAAHRLDHASLCFLNSYSVIQAGGWLAGLAAALRRGGLGLVGTTGSWGSQLSYIRYDLGFGGLYAGVFGDRKHTRELFRALASDNGGSQGTRRTLARKVETGVGVLRRCVSFEPFPAHHVRTNAFLVPREVMVRVRGRRQRDKLDAFRFESGRQSLSRQVQGMGFGIAVVGRDGCVYECAHWPRSYTFWQGRQQNLLVADNQTTAYENADAETREALSHFAWGPAADPAATAGSVRA